MGKQEKSELYRLQRFTPEQIVRFHQDIVGYAQAINGLPQRHGESLEKRGWLVPFLLAYDGLLWGRWDYWTNILMRGTITGSGPIPQIRWTDPWSTSETLKWQVD